MSVKRLKNSRPIRVIRGLITRFFQDNVSQSAAELAYYLLFSLFPILIFLNAAIGMFQIDVNELNRELGLLLPQEVLAIITDYISYVSSMQARTMAYAGLVLGVWSASRSVRSMLRAVSRAYRVREAGLVSKVLPVIITLVLMASVFLLLILLMISKNLLSTVSDYISLPSGMVALWNFIKFLIGPVCIFILLAGFYYVASQRRYRFVQAMPGALFSCIVWTAFSVAFSYYVANFGGYSVLYGSLGAIIILMLWLYATGILLIVGGELNHVLIENKNEKQGD